MPVSIAFAIQKCLPLVTCTLLVALVIGVSGCGGPWRDTYFKKGVGRLTQEEIRERLGPPHTAKTPALGGDSHWTYRFALSEQGPHHVELLIRRRRFQLGHRLDGQGGRNRQTYVVLLSVHVDVLRRQDPEELET